MEELENKKFNKLMTFTFTTLSLGLVSTLTYMIYNIFTHHSLFTIISSLILLIFAGILVLTGYNIENKKAKIFISIAECFLAIYSIFGIVHDVITPKDFVLDFTDVDIKEVISWANERDIKIIQEYTYSDKIDEFHVISQDVEEGTAVKKIDKITVVVSNGSDPSKKAEVTNMVGWNLDDVIKFIDDNHLTNVTIKFEFSTTVEKDKIISQDVIREIKRDEPVTLVSSLGKETDKSSVTLDNLVGLDMFHALVYLGRNNLKYSIVYEYSEENVGTVIKQSPKKWTVIGPNENKEVVITIAKQNEITIPDLSTMTEAEITEWATANRIKIEFEEEYDDTVKAGRVISYNAVKGKVVEVGTPIKVILSKGSIKMIQFTDIDSFRKWADENEIIYNIEHQYSDTVAQGKVISISHNKGDIIKNSDVVKIIISDGGNTTIPDLIGLTKDEATSKCNESNIKCNFIYLNNNTEYNVVTKQSMRSGSTVPTNASVTVTLGQ